MTEKVKLPKEVCDALDYAKNTMYLHDCSIVVRVVNQSFVTDETKLLHEQNPSEIMRALVLGYEPEMSQPERELKQLVQNTFNGEKDLYDMGYRYGAWDALRIHGIHYDWLDGAE